MMSEKSDLRRIVASAVEHGAAVQMPIRRRRPCDAIAELAVRDDRDPVQLAVGDHAPRDDARLVFRQKGELVEIRGRRSLIGEKIQRQHRASRPPFKGTTAATSSLVSGPTTKPAPSAMARL